MPASVCTRIEVYESILHGFSWLTCVAQQRKRWIGGQLKGRVIRIESPGSATRGDVCPTGDADARIVEVMVAVDDADARRVIKLTGLKVIARFESS